MRTLRDTGPPPLPPEPTPTALQYDVLIAGDAGELVQAVNAKLAEGWEPLGQPMTTWDHRWYQAMAREPWD